MLSLPGEGAEMLPGGERAAGAGTPLFRQRLLCPHTIRSPLGLCEGCAGPAQHPLQTPLSIPKHPQHPPRPRIMPPSG